MTTQNQIVTTTPTNDHNDFSPLLDVRLTSQDICDIAIVNAEERLLQEREVAMNLLGTANKGLYAATQVVSDLCTKAVESFDFAKVTHPILAALREFDGKDYGYTADKGYADAEKKVIIVNVAVMAKGESNRNLQKNIQIPFTEEISAAVAVAEAATKTVHLHMATLTDIKKQFADLPRLARRVKTAMVTQQLQKTAGGQAVLEAVMSTKSKALPMLTS